MQVSVKGVLLLANICQKVAVNYAGLYAICANSTQVYVSVGGDDGGILRFEWAAPNGIINGQSEKIVSNKSDTCGKAHGLVVENDNIFFSDTEYKVIKCIKDGEVFTIAGQASTDGYQDGKTGLLSQPTGLCLDNNTIFLIDTATSSLRTIVPVNGIITFLKNLNKLGLVFHFSNDSQNEDYLTNAVEMLTSIQEFLEISTNKVKERDSSKNVPEGPEGAVSFQTRNDIAMLVTNIENIINVITKYQPNAQFNPASITTVFVENFFASMRALNDMPTVLEFAHKFANCCREMIKRATTRSFVYFTSRNQHYTQATNSIAFHDLPVMQVPLARNLTTEQQKEMRIWRIENGQGVRQQTVRNFSTKDKPDTLPVNAYFKPMPSKPFSFDVSDTSNLPQAKDNTLKEDDADALAFKIKVKDLLIVKINEFGNVLALVLSYLEDNTLGVRIFIQDCEDLYLFKAQNQTEELNIAMVVALLKSKCYDSEVVRINESEFEKIRKANDLGETSSIQEQIEEENEMQLKTVKTQTRSGRIIKRKRQEDFYYM